MATTYNFTNGSITGQPRMTQRTLEETKVCTLRHVVDFSKQTLEAGEADVGKCLIIPAKTLVLNAHIRVITADGANASVDLGYGGNPDQWGDGVSLAAADVVVGGTLAAPHYFASADTIDVVATTDGADVDIDGAKIEVIAECIKCLDN